MLRRKRPNITNCQIYTEHTVEELDNHYPDIQMILKERHGKKSATTHSIYNFEIQEKVSKAWQEKMIKRYEGTDYIEIPLKKFKKFNKLIDELKKDLEEYII